MDIFKFLIKHKKNLLRRDFLLDLFAICELDTPTTEKTKLYEGQLLDQDGTLVGIDSIGDELNLVTLGKLSNKTPILSIHDYIDLTPDDLINIKKPIKSTVGRFLLNFAFLVDPFGDYFDYINADFSIGKFEDRIVKAALSGKISVSQIKLKYIPNLYFLGHFTEISVPSYTEKSMTTSPAVIKRRKELLDEYRDELDNPIIMARIEDELIKMDKEYLADDPSMGYFGGNGKAFNISRKKTLVIGGILEDFDSETGYQFLEQPYDEGIDPKLFPLMVNDIRRGIYNRAVNTAKGGELAEFIRRIFQDSIISAENCNSQKGLKLFLSSELKEDLLFRWIITSNGLVNLTEENIDKYVGTYITLRSPMYCLTKQGYCYTCMGTAMKARNVKSLTMLTSKVGSRYLSISMKAMHGTKTKIADISDIDKFIIK